MLRHSQPNAATFRNECPDIYFGRELNAAAFSHQCRGIQTRTENLNFGRSTNAAAFIIQCRSIEIMEEKNVGSQYVQCCGIHNPMPRHSKSPRNFFFLNVNAAALGNECCGIGVSAKMNVVTFIPECRGIEPCFCIPLLLYFLTLFLLIFWPEQPMNHKMKEINEK